MPDTFVKIATVTVGSGGASSISFSSIPQTYTDLCLRLSLKTTNSDVDTKLEFNGVTTGYNRTTLIGNCVNFTGGGYAADAWIGPISMNLVLTANTFGSIDIYIPNYTSTTSKSYSTDGVSEANSDYAYLWCNAQLSTITSPISSFSITGLSTALSLAQYSTATLYGISKS